MGVCWVKGGYHKNGEGGCDPLTNCVYVAKYINIFNYKTVK